MSFDSLDASAPVGAVQSTARRWYSLCIITLVYSCHFLDRSVVALVAEPLRKEFGLSDSQLGALTGLGFGLMFAIAGIPLGLLVDRRNRRNLLAGMVFLWSGATALCGVAQSYWALLAARMAVGAAESGGAPTAMSLISDLFPPRQRTTAVGFYYLGNAVGGAMCVVVGAFVAVKYGWRAAFFVAGVPGMVLAVVTLLTLREPARGAADTAAPVAVEKFTLRQGLSAMRTTPAVLWLFATAALSSSAVSVFGSWLPPFLSRSHDMTLAQASLVLALSGGLFGAVGAFAGGSLADRLARNHPGRRTAFAAILLCVAIPVALVALMAPGKTWAITGVFGVFLLVFPSIPVSFATVLTLAPARARGITLAAMQALTNLVGYGAGPFATGMISDALGGGDKLHEAMAIVVTACLLGAAFSLYRANRAAAAVFKRTG